jgi:nucleotide-binding universal stress UspA family protein
MYKKVLVPLDGSNLAECALDHIKNLLQAGSIGEVTVLKVVKIDLSWAMGQYGMKIDLNKARESIYASAREYLDGLVARLKSAGISVKTDMIEGERPAPAITEYARSNGMEMIAIASHGYTGLKKLVFGSVADEVLHTSNVPVLLIRPEACRAEEISKAA